MISKILNIALVVIVFVLIGNYFYRLPKYSAGNLLQSSDIAALDNVEWTKIDSSNKALLIHFWGSWCTSCRKENKGIVSTYSEFLIKADSTQKEKFDIVSIALERKDGNAAKAIIRDSLFWTNHIIDLEGFSSEIAKQFGVKKLPTTYLIDKDNKVLFTNPSPKQLAQFLESI